MAPLAGALSMRYDSLASAYADGFLLHVFGAEQLYMCVGYPAPATRAGRALGRGRDAGVSRTHRGGQSEILSYLEFKSSSDSSRSLQESFGLLPSLANPGCLIGKPRTIFDY